MSVKIYNAYRLKEGVDLWQFAHDARITCTSRVQRTLRKLYMGLLEGAEKNPEEFKKARTEAHPENGNYYNKKDKISFLDIHEYVRDLYKVQVTSSFNDPFALDVNMSIRRYKNRYYIIHYSNGIFSDVWDFLKRDPRVEDFHYQNQTDRPKDITEKEWEHREKTWRGMDLWEDDDRWHDCLMLDIVSFGGWFRISPWIKMERARQRSKKMKENVSEERKKI